MRTNPLNLPFEYVAPPKTPAEVLAIMELDDEEIEALRVALGKNSLRPNATTRERGRRLRRCDNAVYPSFRKRAFVMMRLHGIELLQVSEADIQQRVMTLVNNATRTIFER